MMDKNLKQVSSWKQADRNDERSKQIREESSKIQVQLVRQEQL